MKEKLQNWALVAEIISGFAIVITLIFLVIEVRSNSNLIRANAFDQNMQGIIDWRMTLISSDEGLQLAIDRWSLGDKETAQRNMWFQTMWNLYEKAYYANVYSLIGDSEWQRFEYNICENYYIEIADNNWDVGIAGTIETGLAQRLTPAFVEYIESLCLRE